MTDALEILREVDRHFQSVTQRDVPGQIASARIDRDTHCEQYDIWRRVRQATDALEAERKNA